MSALVGAELPEGALSIFDLTGRVAIVTGAAGGVGRGCAEILAAAGAHVLAADVQDTNETVGIIKARSGSAESAVLDVADKDAFESLVADVRARHGRVDVVVNNAGIQRRST